MNLAQLTLPGFPKDQPINSIVQTGPGQAISEPTLGGIVSAALNIVFIIAGFLLFGFLIWSAFQFMLSQGNKEALAKARQRVTWALVGFLLIVLAFAIRQYIEQILSPGNVPVTPVIP